MPLSREDNVGLLETIVDDLSLHEVVKALVTIAMAKADHLRANWQDDLAARQWDIAAGRLDRIRIDDV
jgi:hypothetical protein